MEAAIGEQAAAALQELIVQGELQPGSLIVIGCSTSEVIGRTIGTAGSQTAAQALLTGLRQVAERERMALAIQCCEHLNRALVVEREVLEQHGLAEVSAFPVPTAGGALAAQAMLQFAEPALVEEIQADAGLDIGNTLIGMHLKRVAVPLRLANSRIGETNVVAARTRPKLIGGCRAVYSRPVDGVDK
nr:TIGR01440 family protein [uncultured Anaeromusa sp.]